MEWLLTYVVHSTALIAVVWLATSLIPRISLGTQEALWKVALLGPLLTASVALAVPSAFGQLPMPQALRTETARPVAPAPATESAPATVERRIVRHRTGELEITAVRQRQAEPVAAAAARPTPAGPTPWPYVLLGLWGVGAVVALGRLAWAARRLRQQLQGRRDVIEDPVLESFLDLCSKAGLKKRPRLTASPHLRSPIALGRREICLPERAVDSLTPHQQQGMLAHEMAHLVRRDPQWTVVTAIIEGVMFFQPLNHLARRKIQEVAEFQCDDWAARHTGTGVHLAKCLAEVAGWVEDGPPAAPVVVSMADRGSPIVRRITRLLHQQRKGGRVHPAGRVALTVGTLGLVIALVPGVGRAGVGGSSSPAGQGDALAMAQGSGSVIFEDLSEPGHDRSVVRLQSNGEVVEIEVRAPRALPPPPAPPPPPEPQGDRIEIMIHGHYGWDGPWLGGVFGMGALGLDFGEGQIEVLIEDDDLFGLFGEVYGWDDHIDRAHARAERARERADRARERALRHAERAREHAERARERAARHRERAYERDADERDGWGGIFGVSWEEPRDDDAEPETVEL